MSLTADSSAAAADARSMTDQEYAQARAELIGKTQAAALRRHDETDLAATRGRFPETAEAADQAAACSAVKNHRALVKRLVVAELQMVDAAKLNEMAVTGPSQLDRTRAAERLVAAVRDRDALTLATEAAHRAAYPNINTGVTQ